MQNKEENREKLKEIRKKFNLTQDEMAPLMAMKQGHYSRLESGYEGRSPTKQQLHHAKTLLFIHESGFLKAIMHAIKVHKWPFNT